MMRNPLSKKITGIEPSGIRKFFDLVSEMPDAISLGVGEPDFDTPWRIREEGIYTLEQGKTFYTSNAGLKDLKIEISKYLERKIHVEYDPDHEIMVTVGGSEGIDVALRAMLDPGDEVLTLYHSGRRKSGYHSASGKERIQTDGRRTGGSNHAKDKNVSHAIPEQPDRIDHDKRRSGANCRSCEKT